MWQAQFRSRSTAPFEDQAVGGGIERRYRVEIEAFEFVTRTESQ